jgi:hypothetical protein
LYHYGNNSEHEEGKMIGIYSSRELAEKTIERYMLLPGFREYSAECFNIDKVKLDEEHWSEGFVDNDYYK